LPGGEPNWWSGSDLLIFFSLFSSSHQLNFSQRSIASYIIAVLLDEAAIVDMAQSDSDPLSTSQIKDWRSIITLIVFILTSEF
jgi:hypothetical protein